MSETTKEEKAKILEAIDVIQDALNKEVDYESNLSNQAKTAEGRAFHSERTMEYSCGRTALMKLKAKIVQKNG